MILCACVLFVFYLLFLLFHTKFCFLFFKVIIFVCENKFILKKYFRFGDL